MIELTQKSSLVAYDTPTPKPMAIFTERVRHPDNERWIAEAAERLSQFHPIPKWELYRIQWRVNRLNARLRRLGVFDRVKVLRSASDELTKAMIAYRDIRGEAERLQAEYCPMPADLFARGRKAKNEVRRLRETINTLEMQMQPHEHAYSEYVRLCDRLEAHIDAVKRREQEVQNEKQFFREGKVIERALKETFVMTEGCHIKRFKKNGKVKRIPPKFQEVYLNSYVHGFVLLTSKRTFMGGWKNKLQVNIHELIDPKTTLKNASAILHRQVYVDYDPTGSLPIFKVNRLDVQGGLPERVNFAGLMEIYPVSDHELVPIPVGLGENFRAKWMNLEITPHILIAGATRSGKSNFCNAFLASLLYMQSPDEVRLLAIDGKAGVEFFRYRDVPHLIMPVVDDANMIRPALIKATGIMNKRFQRLKDSGTTKLLEFNRAVPAEQRMARVVVFIDEMLSLINRDDTQELHAMLANLTAKGAAAGVHVVMATQYPNAEVIPMLVKNNCDGIVALRMANVHGSLMLLNDNTAYSLEKVKGRAQIADAGDRYKCQTPYLPPAENERAIRFAISKWEAKPFAELENLDDTAPLDILPVTTADAVSFTEQDALAIIFDQMNGELNGERLWEIVQEKKLNVTAATARAIVRELKTREVITFNGKAFEPTKIEGFRRYRLVEMHSDDETTKQQSNASVEPAVQTA